VGSWPTIAAMVDAVAGLTAIAATALVNDVVNDVAMTVLPNAPIDSVTGLPIPTIAVATKGGVSVIKDDGTVVDITDSESDDAVFIIDFTDDGMLAFSYSDSTSQAQYPFVWVGDLPSVDTACGTMYGYADQTSTIKSEHYNAIASTSGGSGTNGSTVFATVPSFTSDDGIYGLIPTKKRKLNIGSEGGLAIINRPSPHLTRDSQVDGSVAYITSDYNTGYMTGDTKGAWLSDTDATDVTGSNLIVNGDFSSDSDWDVSSSLYSIGSGVLTSLSSNSAIISPDVDVVPVVGKTYVLTFDITAYSAGTIYVNFGHIWVTGDYHAAGVGSYSFTFTPTSTAQNFSFYTASFGGSIDNVVLKEADPDRSVNGNALQVFGTVDKDAVATGAELVAYSGFTASDYLEQPYNSDMNFTTDMSISYWIKGGGTGESLMDRGSGTRNSEMSWHIYHDGGSDYRLSLHSDGATEQEFEIADVVGTSTWQNVVWTLSGGVVKAYWNGDEKSSGSFSGTLTSQSSTKHPIRIGRGVVGSYHSGELALVRISATAPSAEQIKDIYEAEKVLFQENADCTLNGSADAVTALDYDDYNDELLVGTSGGLSVFKGLRRVEENTNAITEVAQQGGLRVEEY